MTELPERKQRTGIIRTVSRAISIGLSPEGFQQKSPAACGMACVRIVDLLLGAGSAVETLEDPGVNGSSVSELAIRLRAIGIPVMVSDEGMLPIGRAEAGIELTGSAHFRLAIPAGPFGQWIFDPAGQRALKRRDPTEPIVASLRPLDDRHAQRLSTGLELILLAFLVRRSRLFLLAALVSVLGLAWLALRGSSERVLEAAIRAQTWTIALVPLLLYVEWRHRDLVATDLRAVNRAVRNVGRDSGELPAGDSQLMSALTARLESAAPFLLATLFLIGQSALLGWSSDRRWYLFALGGMVTGFSIEVARRSVWTLYDRGRHLLDARLAVIDCDPLLHNFSITHARITCRRLLRLCRRVRRAGTVVELSRTALYLLFSAAVLLLQRDASVALPILLVGSAFSAGHSLAAAGGFALDLKIPLTRLRRHPALIERQPRAAWRPDALISEGTPSAFIGLHLPPFSVAPGSLVIVRGGSPAERRALVRAVSGAAGSRSSGLRWQSPMAAPARWPSGPLRLLTREGRVPDGAVAALFMLTSERRTRWADAVQSAARVASELKLAFGCGTVLVDNCRGLDASDRQLMRVRAVLDFESSAIVLDSPLQSLNPVHRVQVVRGILRHRSTRIVLDDDVELGQLADLVLEIEAGEVRLRGSRTLS